MTLAQKALVLLIVPLLFDLSLICALTWLTERADAQARDMARSREVTAQSALLTRLIFEQLGLYTNAVVQTEPISKGWQIKRYHEKSTIVRTELAKLSTLVSDSPLKSHYLDCIATIHKITDRVESNAAESSITGAVSLIRNFNAQISELTTKLDKANRQEKERIETLSKREASLRNSIRSLGLAGCCLNIALTLALSLYFYRSTVSRLKLLMRKLIGWARNQPIEERLTGNDELVQLDHAFEEMIEIRSSMESQIKEGESRYLTVVNTIPIGLVTLDTTLRITGSNRAFLEMTGESEDDIKAKNFLNSLDKVQPEWQEQFLQTQNRLMFESLLRRKDGSTIPVEVKRDKFTLHQQTELLVTLTDISQRSQLETMKRDFYNMISHDVRSPLTSLQISLEQLRMGACGSLSDAGSSLVKRASRNLNHALSLITDFLDLEKIQSTGFKLKLSTVEARSLIFKAVDMVGDLASQKQLRINSECPSMVLRCDIERIVQVLINLLTNAIKFTEKGHSIDVFAEESEDSVIFRVKDQGRGIPQELLTDVFLQFHQTKPADEAAGFGLGLAICKALVEAHQGTIGASNNAEPGLTIWFSLPKAGPRTTPE